MQLPGGLPDDELQNLWLGIGHNVNFPQVLVQLRQGELDGGLGSVYVHRGQIPHRSPGHIKLAGEHEAHQLHQHPVLGLEQVLEAGVGGAALVQDLAHGGLFIALLQKEPDTGLQNPILRGKTHFCIRQRQSSFPIGL